MLTHTGKKPHECSECHKKFARLTNLKSHMLTHTRKKPHECSECHKKFLLLSTLRSHMLTHTGKKQHECSECHKKFSQSYNLQRHMLTHTGEKPHKCSECHKKFSQSCNLQSHMLTHTEEKAHKCSVCHRRFSQKGSLKIHMSKQHSQWEENLIIITPRIDNVIINCMLTPILTKSIINTGMRNSFTVLYNAILRDVTALIPCALWDNEAIKSAGTKKRRALPLFQFARYTLCRLSCVVRRLRYLFCITDGQGNGLQRFRENR